MIHLDRFNINAITPLFVAAAAALIFSSCSTLTTGSSQTRLSQSALQLEMQELEQISTKEESTEQTTRPTDSRRGGPPAADGARRGGPPAADGARRGGPRVDSASQRRCRDRCESRMDESPSVSGSGAQSNRFSRCMEQCDRLDAVQSDFVRCIQSADSNEARRHCREGYSKQRPQQ